MRYVWFVATAAAVAITSDEDIHASVNSGLFTALSIYELDENDGNGNSVRHSLSSRFALSENAAVNTGFDSPASDAGTSAHVRPVLHVLAGFDEVIPSPVDLTIELNHISSADQSGFFGGVGEPARAFMPILTLPALELNPLFIISSKKVAAAGASPVTGSTEAPQAISNTVDTVVKTPALSSDSVVKTPTHSSDLGYREDAIVLDQMPDYLKKVVSFSSVSTQSGSAASFLIQNKIFVTLHVDGDPVSNDQSASQVSGAGAASPTSGSAVHFAFELIADSQGIVSISTHCRKRGGKRSPARTLLKRLALFLVKRLILRFLCHMAITCLRILTWRAPPLRRWRTLPLSSMMVARLAL